MGQEILYCVACQMQLRGTDFDKRRAVRVDGKGYCLPCGQKLFPPDRLAASGNPGAPPPSTRLNIKPPTRRAVTPSAAPSLNRSLAIGGAAVLVVAGIGIAMLSSKPPVVEPPPPPPPPVVKTPPKEVPKREEPALKVFPALAGLDEEFQRALDKDEFPRALQLIESARGRHKDVEWTQIMTQRTNEVQAHVDRTLGALKAKAVDAKRAGNQEEWRKIRERIAKWQVPRALPELDAALAAVPDSGKLVYFEDFNAGVGRFEQGALTDGALSVPPKGVALGNPFPAAFPASAVIRFRVNPPAELKQLEVVMWSNTLKLNCWIHVTGLRPNEWQPVELKASEFRGGWNREGPPLIGQTANTLHLYFDGTGPDVRVLVDDFEIRE